MQLVEDAGHGKDSAILALLYCSWSVKEALSLLAENHVGISVSLRGTTTWAGGLDAPAPAGAPQDPATAPQDLRVLRWRRRLARWPISGWRSAGRPGPGPTRLGPSGRRPGPPQRGPCRIGSAGPYGSSSGVQFLALPPPPAHAGPRARDISFWPASTCGSRCPGLGDLALRCYPSTRGRVEVGKIRPGRPRHPAGGTGTLGGARCNGGWIGS